MSSSRRRTPTARRREVEKNRLILITDASPVSTIDTTGDSYSINKIDSIIAVEKQSAGSIFKTDFAQFEFSWNDAPVGSKIYFNFNNYFKLLEGLSEAIYVMGGSNNLFTLNVRSSSPFSSKVIADNVIRQFREARMEQQRQTVRYSFQFIDEQLIEVQKKLLDAESKLSNFRASGEIITISDRANELSDYLSTLEAEKLQTNILLSDYSRPESA